MMSAHFADRLPVRLRFRTVPMVSAHCRERNRKQVVPKDWYVTSQPSLRALKRTASIPHQGPCSSKVPRRDSI